MKLKNIYLLVKNNKFQIAIEQLNKLSKEYSNNFDYFYLKGFSHFNLNETGKAIENFSTAINFKQDNIEAYFYRGIAHFKLNNFDEAKTDYNKAISLKPNLSELYNNLASVNYKIGENEEAIKNFVKSLNLNNNLKSSILGLVNVLSQTNDVKIDTSDIVITHNKLNEINFEYSEHEYIDDLKIKEFLYKANKIIDYNLKDLELDIIQTYREQKSQPNCKRHHKVFNKFNLIPEFCFGCYKILIEPENVAELIKLHIIFDNYNFKNNNIRKCMIELRPNITGKYKGLIYCDSIDEAEDIQKQLLKIININFNKILNCKIKRGCSEFAIKFHNFDSLKNDAMTYDPEWKKSEILFDKKNPDLAYKKKTRSTISGLSLFDALVIRNWLAFAKITGDKSHEKVSDKIFSSKLIDRKLMNINH